MTDQERRIRAAELMGWVECRVNIAGCDVVGFQSSSGDECIERVPDPDHCLDDAVKLLEACGLDGWAMFTWSRERHKDNLTCVYHGSGATQIAGEINPARALTSAVLKAMEEKGGRFADLGPINITDGEPSEDYIRRLRDGGKS